MIKTKIVETVEEYDADGKLVRRTVTETEETDDNPTMYTISHYVPATAYCGSMFDEKKDSGEIE